MEILWTFSIYLESLAILPQLFMVTKTGEAESITSHYLFALGMYRALYILNWVYRYYFEGTLEGYAQDIMHTVYCFFKNNFCYLQVSMTSLRSWLAACRRSSIATSFTFMLQRCLKARNCSFRLEWTLTVKNEDDYIDGENDTKKFLNNRCLEEIFHTSNNLKRDGKSIAILFIRLFKSFIISRSYKK